MTTELERAYWDEAALDPEVDTKYISDVGEEYFWNVLGEMPGDVLDLGCGVGRLLKEGYAGCDISANMLSIAEAKHPDNDLRICDGRAIPFHDSRFDFVYSALMFQHIPRNAKMGYITEAYRVLKPGGTLIVQFVLGTTEQLIDHNTTEGEMSQFFKLAGFTDLQIRTELFRDQWCWIRGTK